MRIEEIKKTKNGKYKLKIDGLTMTTYDDVLLKNNLLYKKDIDVSLYEKINQDHEYYDAYNKTINYALRRVRSIKEVKQFLAKFSLSSSDKEKIIKHLEDIGLISDQKFVKSYLSDAIYLGNDGPKKIKEYLLSLDISEELIDAEIANIDKDYLHDKMLKMINKKIKNNHSYSSYQLKQKIVLDMVNLGYDRNDVLSLLEHQQIDDDLMLEKEYQRQYEKLRRKYNGYELSNKIKQKLYAKGFDINLINEFIAKQEDE